MLTSDVLYDMTGIPCGAQMPSSSNISCNFSYLKTNTGLSETATSNSQNDRGTAYNKIINMLKDHVYYLYINKWTTGSEVGFTLDFTGTDACILEKSYTVDIMTSKEKECIGEAFTLFANTTSNISNTKYLWAPTSAIVSQNENSVTMKLQTSQNVTVQARENNGCDGNAQKFIVAESCCPKPIISGKPAFCKGSTTTINSNSETANQWNFNGLPITGATNKTLEINQAGNYSVTVISSTCTSTSEQVYVKEDFLLTPPLIDGEKNYCPLNKTTLTVKNPEGRNFPYTWYKDALAISSSENPSFAISLPGKYSVEVRCPYSGCITRSSIVIIEDCFSCTECIPSFSPQPGQKYLLSAWVKEKWLGNVPVTYKNSGIQLAFNSAESKIKIMQPTGPIVEGWQRIEAAFTVPEGASRIFIDLVNLDAPGDVFFDDIRIHPFKSNMKSFVYDPSTQKLVAELDENNYATKYEYDDEGTLIRVKKETERGVMTIKETRSNQSKIK